MITQIVLQRYAKGSMIGMRSTATPIRQLIERGLSEGHDIAINFTGVEVTQSFVDELLGAIILRRGPQVMRHVILRGCSDTTKSIIKFVTHDRADQFLSAVH